MPLAHTDPPSGVAAPTRPDLPRGWSYSDEVDERDRFAAARRRRLVGIVAIAVVVVLAVPLLLVLNAQRHCRCCWC
jgi:hypothetical protein